MRVMPHRVASQSSVTFSEPRLRLGPEEYGPDDPVVPWDYLSTVTLVTAVAVDEKEFLRSTALETLEGVVAHLQVDCPPTGSRCSSVQPLRSGESAAELEITIGPGEVAQRIEVTQSVLLDRAGGTENPRVAAFRRGSRLWQSERTFRFTLEGSASAFPTEAFSFSAAGLPPAAAWKLQFEPIALDEPYLGAVRLLINSEHPQAPELLAGRPSLIRSVLFHSVLEQLLTTAADRFAGDVALAFDVDSVGDVLNRLTTTYLGVSLKSAVDRLREDRAETLCRLQAGTSFLQVEGP